MNDPARTERHLVLLDRLAELGVALAERICETTHPTHDQHRAFDTLSRNVRRTILLSHLIATNQLPKPRETKEAEPTTTTEATPGAPRPPRRDDRARLDTLDCLDVLTDPIEQTVARIAADIQTVLDRMLPNPEPSPSRAGQGTQAPSPIRPPPDD